MNKSKNENMTRAKREKRVSADKNLRNKDFNKTFQSVALPSNQHSILFSLIEARAVVTRFIQKSV